MVDRRTWKEFLESGLMWWVNSILNVFGWAIVLEVEDRCIVGAYPARVDYRGFNEPKETAEYVKRTSVLK